MISSVPGSFAVSRYAMRSIAILRSYANVPRKPFSIRARPIGLQEEAIMDAKVPSLLLECQKWLINMLWSWNFGW